MAVQHRKQTRKDTRDWSTNTRRNFRVWILSQELRNKSANTGSGKYPALPNVTKNIWTRSRWSWRGRRPSTLTITSESEATQQELTDRSLWIPTQCYLGTCISRQILTRNIICITDLLEEGFFCDDAQIVSLAFILTDWLCKVFVSNFRFNITNWSQTSLSTSNSFL